MSTTSAAGACNVAASESGPDTIYARPRDYDLEHAGDEEDIRYYSRLMPVLQPGRVLELGSGSGRITIPLARIAAEVGFEIVGLEIADSMLCAAEQKRESLDAATQRRLSFVNGDVKTWRSARPFDLIIAPCSSLSHLLTLDDQLAAWQCAYENLRAGGRFIADLAMPDLAEREQSSRKIDRDTRDLETGERLVRRRTTRYFPHEQRAQIRFQYDKFLAGQRVDRYVSDFDCHVYYPRELDLLFRCTGFEVVDRHGDYHGGPLRATSRQLIVIGRKHAS